MSPLHCRACGLLFLGPYVEGVSCRCASVIKMANGDVVVSNQHGKVVVGNTGITVTYGKDAQVGK